MKGKKLNGNIFLNRNHEENKVLAQYFSSTEEKNYQSRILLPVKISFKIEGETKTFSDEGKLRKFVTNSPPERNGKVSFLNRMKILCYFLSSL